MEHVAPPHPLPVADQPESGPLRVAISGHRSIAHDPAVAAAVLDAMTAVMRALAGAEGSPRPLAVVSMLAQGADILGMRAGLACGATLAGVLPFPVADYRTTFDDEASLADFDGLCGRLASLDTLDGRLGDDEAYAAANAAILGRCDLLLAVWDGAPARGRGGTAEVVAAAHGLGLPVIRLRPAAAAEPTLLTPGGESPFRGSEPPVSGNKAAFAAGLSDPAAVPSRRPSRRRRPFLQPRFS